MSKQRKIDKAFSSPQKLKGIVPVNPSRPSKSEYRLMPKHWVARHGDVLYRYALLRVRKPELAEEIVQDALLAALQAVDSFEGRSKERTWLMGILRHKMIDHIRKASANQQPEIENEAEENDRTIQDTFTQGCHWADKPTAWKDQSVDLVENREFWQAYRSCLDGLPDKYADAFTLRDVETMASEEICKIFNISPSNLWARLHRARLLLRRCLEIHWFQRESR